MAWSTPFLNTDQNEPVSPWVIIANLIVSVARRFAPKATVGAAPSAVSPAAVRPPVDEEAAAREPGLLDRVEHVVGHDVASLSFRGRLERDVDSLTRDRFGASHLLDRDRAPLGSRLVGRDRDRERGACVREGARALAASAHCVEEGGELGR